MALVLNSGAIFLHVPKTGGSWVRAVLEELDLADYELGHAHGDMDHVSFYAKFASGRQYLKYLIRKKLLGQIRRTPEESYYRFCFVRHPVSWYESWWRYNADRGWPEWGDRGDVTRWHPNADLNGLGADEFNAYVRRVIGRYPGYVTDLFGGYTKSCDFVGKQENLVTDLVAVLAHLGVAVDEQKLRSITRSNTSDSEREVEWDPDLLREVERLEYAGIVRYGYRSRTRDLAQLA